VHAGRRAAVGSGAAGRLPAWRRRSDSAHARARGGLDRPSHGAGAEGARSCTATPGTQLAGTWPSSCRAFPRRHVTAGAIAAVEADSGRGYGLELLRAHGPEGGRRLTPARGAGRDVLACYPQVTRAVSVIYNGIDARLPADAGTGARRSSTGRPSVSSSGGSRPEGRQLRARRALQFVPKRNSCLAGAPDTPESRGDRGQGRSRARRARNIHLITHAGAESRPDRQPRTSSCAVDLRAVASSTWSDGCETRRGTRTGDPQSSGRRHGLLVRSAARRGSPIPRRGALRLGLASGEELLPIRPRQAMGEAGARAIERFWPAIASETRLSRLLEARLPR